MSGLSTLLDAICDEQNLWQAWTEVRRKGRAPGVDYVNLSQFEVGVEEWIPRLQRQLLNGTYYAQPLRGVWIPKANGERRPLSIPTVRDRVAQRACLQVMLPLIDPELEDASFAYRPGRSIHQAIAAITIARDAGKRFVMEADIDECFDSLPRERVLSYLAQYVKDADVLALVRQWIEVGTVWDEQLVESPRGIPQGSPLSPLLCNVYLDMFDETLEDGGYRLVRYADDFLVLTATERRAQKAWDLVDATLRQLDLRLDESKSRLTTFEAGFKYLGTIFVGNLVLPTVRVERERPDGESEVLFVPDYPGSPRRRQQGSGPARQKRHEERPRIVKATGADVRRYCPPRKRGRKPNPQEPQWEPNYLV